MDLTDFHERRRLLRETERQPRTLCLKCFQPDFGCYCAHLQPFDPKIRFIILIHPIEVKRRIATGRMSHLSLKRSRLIMGKDFTENAEVSGIVSDPNTTSVMLYPGPRSRNLTENTAVERSELFPKDKDLAIFVIDGTWATARKMVRSANLRELPRICFTPSAPSKFQVRKQPAEGCFSTIEAIHQTIELVGEGRGFDVQSRTHDRLLDVFQVMVERQLRCVREIKSSRQAKYRRELKRAL